MGKQKKRKKHMTLLAVTTVLVVTAGVLFAGRHVIIQNIKTKAAVEIGRKMLEAQIGQTVQIGGQEADVSDIAAQIEEQMDEEDVQKVTEIAEKYISPENIRQAADMAASGDAEGLRNLAEGQISEEDRQELQGLYDKYKDQIQNYIP